jgi:16S rRNA (adenine1518-N6/adenine1519-N6)-dimethyltransferase
MPLYRPSELLAFLSSIGAAPKRTLSQNFLVDGNILSKIVSEVPKSSVAFEIGPGPGVLTEALLEGGYTVVAVETDKAFAAALSRLDPSGTSLTVVEADILKCLWTQLVPKGATLVSNLPYHITTPIIEQLIEAHHHFPRAVLMMQNEAALRLMDAPSSAVGVLLGCFYDVQYAWPVPKACFWPKPDVDSAVLCLQSSTPFTDLEGERRLKALVREAFAHKRKKLLSSVKRFFPQTNPASIVQKIGISPMARPEDLSIQQWKALTAVLEGGFQG